MEFLTLKEVAAQLRMNDRTINRYCQTGYIPHYKIGNKYRFDKEVFNEWLKGQNKTTKGGEVK